MKKQSLFIFIFLLVFSTGPTLQAQKRNVKGSGDVKTEQRSVSAFNKIKASGMFSIYLTQGNNESLEVEADDNLLTFIETEVRNNTLYISFNNRMDLKKWEKMNIYLEAKAIEEIQLSGMCNLEGQGTLESENLVLSHSGMGTSSLEVIGKTLEIRNSGMGEVELRGSIGELDIHNAGMGKVNTEELSAQYVKVNNCGMGNAQVYASEELSISNSGMGKVKYSGNGSVTHLSSSGMASVKKKN